MSIKKENGEFTDVINKGILKRKAITSYSVVLHTLINGDIYYLIGMVRDTIPYKEFVFSKMLDSEIFKYMKHITKREVKCLLDDSFQDIIDDMIINRRSKMYRIASEKYENFQDNIKRYKNILLDNSHGLENSPWIFPKGRKQDNESERMCALREFEEETQISANCITLYDENDIDTMEEIYTGLDGKLYKTVYFLGYINYTDYHKATEYDYIITKKRATLSDEITKIKWLPYNDAVKLLDNSKGYILRNSHTFLSFFLDRDKPERRNSF
jgi:8-oxo-dGTP pyrophosphatase MutT (NUDIX family)